MGTPLPPNEPGDPCTVCWGPGKEFGSGPTPKVIQLRLTRLLPGEHYTEASEQFLLTTHHLEQLYAPCYYTIDARGFRLDVLFWLGSTHVLVSHVDEGWGVFYNTTAPECSLDLENLFTSPADNVMYGGFANITWSTKGL